MMARCATMITAAALCVAVGQAIAQPVSPAPGSVQGSRAQLDDLLAPVALYPDPLLSQILMAAGYPVEVVQADRWLADPGNARLTDGDLAAVVNQQAWDPSVKSLVPFPRILAMLDSHLDWTQDLGDAFIADPAAVMDAVQDLRRRAMAAGKLQSTANLTVSVADGVITILPAAPQEVYYPAYDPSEAYGPWPYPDDPPYALNDAYEGCAVGAFGYCWFGVVVAPLFWGWNHVDWRGHHIRIDPNRFAALNNQRRPSGGTVWAHEGGQRRGVPYQHAETGAHYQPPGTTERPGRGFSGHPSQPPPYRVGAGAGAGPIAVPSRAPTPPYYGRTPQAPPPLLERGPAPRVFAPPPPAPTARPAPAGSTRATAAPSKAHPQP